MKNFKEIFNIENRTKYFFHTLVFLSLLSIIFFYILLIGERALNRNEVEAKVEINNPFDEISLEAKSAFVWDVINQRELFSKNSDVPLPLASLTKVMTAITADLYLPPDAKVIIIEEYLKPEGDSGLLVGDTWDAKDLRDFMLMTSSNDGAYALASVAQAVKRNGADPQAEFVKKMNEIALDIGLTNSKYINEHGLDESLDRGGAYGTARDSAILFEYALTNHGDIMEATRYKNLNFQSGAQSYNATNTNGSIDEIPGLIASKTGFTDLAGGNLVIAFDASLGRPIIVSILGSSREGRFVDTIKLVEATLEYIRDN
jgi:D-alanyl-D-alanine carboxypeptidase